MCAVEDACVLSYMIIDVNVCHLGIVHTCHQSPISCKVTID